MSDLSGRCDAVSAARRAPMWLLEAGNDLNWFFRITITRDFPALPWYLVTAATDIPRREWCEEAAIATPPAAANAATSEVIASSSLRVPRRAIHNLRRQLRTRGAGSL